MMHAGAEIAPIRLVAVNWSHLLRVSGGGDGTLHMIFARRARV